MKTNGLRVCLVCDVPFPPEGKARICSAECRAKRKADYQKPPKPFRIHDCFMCGEPFHTIHPAAKNCSPECDTSYRAAYAAARAREARELTCPVKTCAICGCEEHGTTYDRTFVCSSKACKAEQRKRRQQGYKRAANPDYKPRPADWRPMTPDEAHARLLEQKKAHYRSEKGAATRQAWLARTAEQRAEWARNYNLTYVKPATEEELRARRRRLRLRALRRFGKFKAFVFKRRNYRAGNANWYADLSPEAKELYLAQKAHAYRVRYRTDPELFAKTIQRRREGAAALQMLTDIGMELPFGTGSKRKAQREARRIVIKLGFAQTMQEAVK